MIVRSQITRLGKSTLIYGVGGLINRFAGFLLLPVLTAYLSPSEYGISSLLGWITFLVTPIFSLGIGAACAPCYFRENSVAQKENTVWTAFTLLAITGTILSGLGVLFRYEISILGFQTATHAPLIWMSLMSTSLSLLAMPLMLYLQFEEKAKLFVFLTAIGTVISVFSTLGFVVLLGRGVRGLVEASLLTQVANVALFARPAFLSLRFRFTLGLWRELLRLGIPLVPSFAFIFVIQHGNRYILQEYAGLDALGIYTIGFNLGMVLGLLVSAFQSAWLPFFMSFVERREEAVSLFGRVMTYYVLSVGSLSLLFFIFAKPAVVLLTQPAYHESYKAVGFASASQFLTGVFYILLPSMYFAGKVKYVSLIQGVSGFLSVVISFLLIRRYGLVGAGLGLVVGTLSMVVLTHLWNLTRGRDYLAVPYEWKKIVPFGVLYVMCSWITLYDFGVGSFGEIALGVCEVGVLGTLLYLSISREERMALRNAILARI